MLATNIRYAQMKVMMTITLLNILISSLLSQHTAINVFGEEFIEANSEQSSANTAILDNFQCTSKA